jgi:hypothetical protein
VNGNLFCVLEAKRSIRDKNTSRYVHHSATSRCVTTAKNAQSKDKKAAAAVAADKAENAEKAVRLAKRTEAKFIIATADAMAKRAAVDTSDAAAARAAVELLEDLKATADAACARKDVDALIAAADAAAARAAADAGQQCGRSFRPCLVPPAPTAGMKERLGNRAESAGTDEDSVIKSPQPHT